MGSKLRNTCFLLMVMAFVVLTGGCGGGGDGSDPGPDPDPVPKGELKFDADGDGVMDVFDAYPNDPERFAYATTVHGKADAGGPVSVPRTFLGTLELPVMSGDIPVSEDVHEYTVEIKAGARYYVVIYDPELNFSGIPGFVPSVSVEGPDGAPCPLSPSEKFSKPDYGLIVLEFMSVSGGDHKIRVRNPDIFGQKAQLYYCFDLIGEQEIEEGNSGFLKSFKAPNGGLYRPEDVLSLASGLTDDLREKLAARMGGEIFELEMPDGRDGFASGASPGYAQITQADVDAIENEWSESLASTNGDYPEAGGTTRLNPTAVIAWNSKEHDWGNGLDAATGMQAGRLRAVVGFTIPGGNSTSDNRDTTMVKFISNESEHMEEFNIGGSVSFNAAKRAVDASMAYGNSIKYSESTTTMMLEYDRREGKIRSLEPNQYSLTDEAKKYLQANGPAKFRELYGDYFVAGARYGASYHATVSIKTRSSEKVSSVKGSLSGAYFLKAKVEFEQKFRDATKDCEISIKTVKVYSGAGGSEVAEARSWNGSAWVSEMPGQETWLSADAGANAIEAILNEMEDFVKKSNSPDFLARYEAYLLRFNQISGGQAIPVEIDMDSGLFGKIREMARCDLGLNAAAQCIADIDRSEINAEVKEQYASRYGALQNDYEANIHSICRSMAQVETYTGKINALAKDCRLLLARYAFYRKVKDTKWQTSWGGGTKVWMISGIESYPLNPEVNRDIAADYEYHDTYSEGGTPFSSHKHSFMKDAADNRRWIHFKAFSHHSQYRFSDSGNPSIGKKKLYLTGDGEQGYSVNWEAWGKTMNTANYPFAWE